MVDARVQKLARLLVRYCIKAGDSQVVGIRGGVVAEPLFVALYEELLKVGAFPVVNMAPAGVSELFYRHGKPHHFTTLPSYRCALARSLDATISIHSENNTRELSGANPGKQAVLSKTLGPISRILLRKPWVVTLFPSDAYAQDAEMSLRDFEDFVFGSMYLDEKNPIAAWKALKRRQDRLIGKLAGADEIRIIGKDTDLKLSVKGRKFINSDGTNNMPSGEVFTGPVEDSAEGFITYDYPVCRAGREIEGIRLVFRKGRVVEATAGKNGKFLRAMLDIDPGARRLGELGIGTNTRINRFTRNILFDEKIGGTVHLAVGKSYALTGGKNKSALHWDMIKDLRKGGAIHVDGKVFQRDGKFGKNR